MPYVTLAKLKAGLPADILAQLLDDTGTGVADTAKWNAIVTSVQEEIDGRIGQRYSVPLPDPVPAVIANAAFVLAAELLYQGKGFFKEHNPWYERAQGIRGTMGVPGGQPGLLDKLASGEQQLTPTTAPTKPIGGVLIEQSRIFPARPTDTGRGNMMS